MSEKEILDLFNAVNARIADLEKRLDSVFMSLHNSSTSNISENDTAICDVAELSDENASAIEDLDARVTALEEKE